MVKSSQKIFICNIDFVFLVNFVEHALDRLLDQFADFINLYKLVLWVFHRS
jgi:hypothetical protein